MVVIGQNMLYLVKVVVFGQKLLYLGKLFYWCKNGYIRGKVDVFAQKWLYSG